MRYNLYVLIILIVASFYSCQQPGQLLDRVFQNPPESAKPWVFWYWMQAAVSEEGITADLEAMKNAGIGGAYLMPIKGVTEPPLYEPPAQQLTPHFWKLVKHAFSESDRLGLKLAMHASDGFALAGGPWITPELSMQKVVWSKMIIDGNQHFNDTLPQPESYKDYYQDIALFAYPIQKKTTVESSVDRTVHVTTNTNVKNTQYLANLSLSETFRSKDSCWIQYQFDKPFTCRNITVYTSSNNYQAHRLIVETSNDGRNFEYHTRIQPPRHGWQDTDENVTHAIPPVTAIYFRFVHSLTGTEPGAEDLDAAKWSPTLKIKGIELSSEPLVNQYESKNGSIWRISPNTTNTQLPDSLSISSSNIINISDKMNSQGKLDWDVPDGNWMIIRMGHTSTGHTNYTGGGGLGLECDKFNPDAVQLQFDSWFGEAIKQVGPDLARKVLTTFHIDSWECGSQNWSPYFREEFLNRRGYDIMDYLPVYAGIPVESKDKTEQVLRDIRETIIELTNDVFYKVLADNCKKLDLDFTAESIAPTMMSDGLLHYNSVTVPMGEFWLNSPTHDKPNDMLDAVSAGHIYGKPIIQAESFTTVRMDWSEYPGMMKTLQDRNYALGINKLVYHVYTQNPWLDKKPGMTLDGVGLYFQRDQTWWKPGKAWIKYAQRCQALLQQGDHVADIAVFIGEDAPRRSVLPDRLVPVLPGIFGDSVVNSEKERLANISQPQREIPAGVNHSANMANPEDWVNPLDGYAYDSFNKDALLRLAKVENGRVKFGSDNTYGLLVIPGPRKMNPDGNWMSIEIAEKLIQLMSEGATVIMEFQPDFKWHINDRSNDSIRKKEATAKLWEGAFDTHNSDFGKIKSHKIGKGQLIIGPYQAKGFETIGLEPDIKIFDTEGIPTKGIAYTHRMGTSFDIYFISNQSNYKRDIEVSLRMNGKIPEWFNPVTGNQGLCDNWIISQGRTNIPLTLAANESTFIVLRSKTSKKESRSNIQKSEWNQQTINGPWTIQFSNEYGGPSEPVKTDTLFDWSLLQNPQVKFYSGTANYQTQYNFECQSILNKKLFLSLEEVYNIAEVIVNDIPCGVIWTAPFEIDVTKAIQKGNNKIEIKVTNTWANRLIGDHQPDCQNPVTYTTAPYRLEGKPLLKAGLLGSVKLKYTDNN